MYSLVNPTKCNRMDGHSKPICHIDVPIKNEIHVFQVKYLLG